MANRAYKGRKLEIELATTLSLWWSNGEHDDLCWHTHDSGGRATRRSAKGKGTRSAHGDLCNTDRTMQPFFDMFVVEAKRGYPEATLHAIVDQPAKAKQQQYAAWVVQASGSAKAARVPYWMLIHRRDRREALAVLPDNAVNDLERLAGCCLEDLEHQDRPVMRLYCPAVYHSYVWVFLLNDLLSAVTSAHVVALAQKLTKKDDSFSRKGAQ